MLPFPPIKVDVIQAIDFSPLIISPQMLVADVLAKMNQPVADCAIGERAITVNSINWDNSNFCALVMEQDHLVGIITGRDLLCLSVINGSWMEATIAEVMSQAVITVQYKDLTDLFVPFKLFSQHNIHHLPVIDDQNHLVGLLSHLRLQQLLQTEDQLQSVLVKEVMNRNVLTADSTCSVLTLIQRIIQHSASSIVIVKNLEANPRSPSAFPLRMPIGILTEQDLVQLQTLAIDLASLQASEVMSPIPSVQLDDSLKIAKSLMQSHQVHQVVVTGDQGKLLGTISAGAWFQALNPLDLYQQFEQFREQVIQLKDEKLLWQAQTIEKQQAEQALQASEKRLRTIIETSTSGHVAVNSRGQIIFANPAASKMLGLSVEKLYGWSLGLPCACGSGPEEIALHQPSGKQCVATMQTVPISWDGHHACLISLADITDLNRTKESLRQSETRYRLLVENLPVGLLVIHSNTLRILNSNAKACELLGLTADQIQDKNVLHLNWQFLREDETPMQPWEYPFHQVLATNRPIQNYVVGLQQSATLCVWLLVNAFPLFDRNHELQQVVVTFVDISDRRQAEIKLRQSERRYASLAQAAPVGIFRTNTEGHCLYVNEQWCQIANLSWEVALGQGWQEALHPDDRDRVTKEWQAAIQANRPFQIEYRFLTRKGAVIWVYGQAVAEQKEDGQIIGYIGTITDITARKQAEQQLHQLNLELEQRVTERTTELAQANQLLKLVMDSIPQRIFWKDRHSVLLGCNHNFAEDIGLTPEKVIGKRPQELFDTRMDVEQSLEADQQVLATGEAKLHLLETIRRSDQSLIWVESNKVPLRDTANNVIGILETYEDISSRRTAEIARRESEEHLQDFLENASDLIQSVSLQDGRFLYVNRAWQKIMGYTWEELQHLNFLEIVDPKYSDQCIQLWQQFQQGTLDRIESIELVMQTKDGRNILVEGSINVRSENGQPSLTQAIFHDITARHAAEVALHESQYLIQCITEASPDILYIYDLQEYRQIHTNKEIYPLLGYSFEDLQGMGQDLLLQLVHPEDIANVVNHHVDLTEANDGDILEIEYRVRDRNNQWHWFISRHTVFSRDAENHPKQIIGAASEITERKRIEAALRQTNAELAHATRLKDEFLANMSHELRTPLNAILGMAEGLREKVFGGLNDRQDHAIATIERSGRHLLELINDILDLAKIEAGKLEIQLAPVGVRHLCESSLAFVKQQAIQKQILIQTEICAHLGEITIDERRIRQVLINLLNNAVKFTHIGGSVMLKVGLQSGQNQDRPLTTSAATTYLYFSVIDTGIGIVQQDLKTLFQAFVQIDSSLNRQQAGTGLGLALVKQITEMHEGYVNVSSEPGKGSNFTIYLPYLNDHSTLPESGQPSQTSAEVAQLNFTELTTIPKILLVEDNEANINTIASYLESRGQQVILARNGQDAVEIAKAELPDIILMDIQMPGMDGLEATRQIRMEPTLLKVPIIALTALAMPEDRDRCLAAGATDYLPKPIRLKQLVTLIQQLLSR